MKILGIESSCDETAAAVVEDGVRILSNVVVSQVDIFAAYGGVIPEVAARSHLEAILPVIHKALDDAGVTKEEIDAIAVTHTPGLMGSLLIGTLTARVLAILWGKPLYAVHHLKSHIYANWLEEAPSVSLVGHDVASPRRCGSRASSFSLVSSEDSHKSTLGTIPANLHRSEEPHKSTLGAISANSQDSTFSLSASEDSHKSTLGTIPANLHRSEDPHKSMSDANSRVPTFPLLALVVSGGHTQIIYMREHNQFEIIGTTRDDAVGECFDKVAKILGLPYPGGPSIAKCAKNGDPTRYKLPHPQVEGLDFSFSGLKTAVLRAVQAECGLPISSPSFELKNHLSEALKADFAASFQATASEILLEKLQKALNLYPEVKSVVFAGGVSANEDLKTRAEEMFDNTFFPVLKYCGDNGAMVGSAAFFEVQTGVKPTDPYGLSIAPRTAIS